jgi:hypothetical protein
MDHHRFILALAVLVLLFPSTRRIVLETLRPVAAAIGAVLFMIGARQR